MSEIKDGGSAFPMLPPETAAYEQWPAHPGMTLRDYFAAKALVRYGPDYTDKMHDAYVQIATNCYAIADAMLKARG